MKISIDQPLVKVVVMACFENEGMSLTQETTGLFEVIIMLWQNKQLTRCSKFSFVVINISFAFAYRNKKAVWEIYVGLIKNLLKAC